MKQKIGFIGLGAMGEPMAKHLLNAGYEVLSCANKNREPFTRLAPLGLKELDSPAQVGEASDILMSIVFDEAQSDTVLRGETGALTMMKPGSCLIIMSTVSVNYCQALAKEAAAKGIAVLDCPVSGMPKGAEEGTLSLFIGGETAAIEKCRDALSCMGTVLPCGDVGSGQLVKLGNNAMFIGTLGILLELREMMKAQNMDFDLFLNYLNQSTGRSFVSEHIKLPPVPTFSVPMPIKDVSHCLQAGQSVGITMPMLETCLAHTLEQGPR